MRHAVMRLSAIRHAVVRDFVAVRLASVRHLLIMVQRGVGSAARLAVGAVVAAVVVACFESCGAAAAKTPTRTAFAGESGPSVFEPFVTVYVSGAVRRPGVLRLPPGSRVADAIQAAGGAVGGAAVADLDLASVVQDGQSVRVPAAGERLGGSSGGVAMGAAPSRVGGQAVAPMPASFDPRSQGGRSRKAQRRRRLPGLPGAPPGSGRLVALNRASAADLQRLPGVGPGLAARILAYRKRVGRFQRVEELREVQGIGEKRLARMAPQVDLR